MYVNLSTTSPYGDTSNYPISVSDLKTQMRISGSDEDALLARYIVTATKLLEKYCSRSFVEQDHVLTLDNVRGYESDLGSFLGSNATIYLGRPPILSVTSVKFYDDDRTETTVSSSDYYVDVNQGRIVPQEGITWQSAQDRLNAVIISYKGGMVADGSGADLPSEIIDAVAMFAIHLYENRGGECSVPPLVKEIIAPHRLVRLGRPYMGIEFANKIIRSGSLAGGY